MKLSHCEFLRLVQNRENICMKYMAYKITVSTCLYSITSLSVNKFLFSGSVMSFFFLLFRMNEVGQGGSRIIFFKGGGAL